VRKEGRIEKSRLGLGEQRLRKEKVREERIRDRMVRRRRRMLQGEN
jgi:hypothetical protein